jgi:hypothetical protein
MVTAGKQMIGRDSNASLLLNKYHVFLLRILHNAFKDTNIRGILLGAYSKCYKHCQAKTQNENGLYGNSTGSATG